LKSRISNMNAAVDAAVNEVRKAYPEGLAEALVAVADSLGMLTLMALTRELELRGVRLPGVKLARAWRAR
jgi:hypothetical protein